MPLRELTLEFDEGPISDGGGSKSRYMRAPDESAWVMKSTYFGSQSFEYLYLNEGLSALLAQEIGAPVPEPAVVRLTPEQVAGYMRDAIYPRIPEPRDRVIFACERITEVEPLSVEAAAAADKYEMAALLVLDQLVWNAEGRKLEHVLVETPGPGAPQLWGIDHGGALCDRDRLADDCLAVDRRVTCCELLGNNVGDEHLTSAIASAQALTHSHVIALVRSLPAEWIIERDAPERLAGALIARAAHLPRLLDVQSVNA